MPQSLEHAIETEWHLLTTLIEAPLETILQVAQDLDPQDFSLSATRSIFSAIVHLAENEGVVDVLQVQKWCDDNRTGVTVDAVIRLTDLGGVLSNIPFYAKLVRKNSLRRRLKSLCDLMSSRLDDQTIETAECMTELVEGTFELQADHKAGVRHMSAIMHDTMNELAAEREHKGGLAGYSTGVDSLDMITGGLRDAEVWVVGAIPGRGKTALGLQACLANVARQTPVLIMSLEMSATQDARRILAQCGDVKSYLIRDPRQMTEVQWCNLAERSAEIGQWPVYIDDCAHLTVRQLISRIRLYVRRYKVKFIVIDYLQLVQGTGRELRERVSQVSNALRIVAKQEGVAIMVLSQLKRPGDINEVPSMLWLKESGDIEANAHTVLLLHCPIDPTNKAPTGEDEIIIGKQRNGPTGAVPVTFDRKHLVFRARAI
jgi:replicative DNA helicase